MRHLGDGGLNVVALELKSLIRLRLILLVPLVLMMLVLRNADMGREEVQVVVLIWKELGSKELLRERLLEIQGERLLRLV